MAGEAGHTGDEQESEHGDEAGEPHRDEVWSRLISKFGLFLAIARKLVKLSDTSQQLQGIIGIEYKEYVDITYSAVGISYVVNKGHSDDVNKVCINQSDP